MCDKSGKHVAAGLVAYSSDSLLLVAGKKVKAGYLSSELGESGSSYVISEKKLCPVPTLEPSPLPSTRASPKQTVRSLTSSAAALSRQTSDGSGIGSLSGDGFITPTPTPAAGPGANPDFGRPAPLLSSARMVGCVRVCRRR